MYPLQDFKVVYKYCIIIIIIMKRKNLTTTIVYRHNSLLTNQVFPNRQIQKLITDNYRGMYMGALSA